MTPASRIERLQGWGRSSHGSSSVFAASRSDQIQEVLTLAREEGRSIAPRAGGNAYGDAALNDDGIVLDLSPMRRVLAWDPSRGIASVEPGVTIQDLWQHTIADGFWPAVVPGTSFVTLGGAAAMNIHGKNNWAVGPIGEHIDEIELVLADGSVRIVRPDRDEELFLAAIGGFGMLGVLQRIDLKLKRVHSGLLEVEPSAAANLAELIDGMNTRLDDADYLVGWIDGFARGRALGRGLLHTARYLAPGEDPSPEQTLPVTAQSRPDRLIGVVPKAALWWPMQLFYNPIGMRAVNEAKFRQGQIEAGRCYRQSHAAFAFLLDFVPNWGRAYGPHGLIQYQSFVPAEHAHAVFSEQLERAQRRRLVPMLGVFKRHRRDAFLMTHGVDGFSLALDFKLTRNNRAAVWELAREYDDLVNRAGGRFYFAKDSTLSPESYATIRADPRTERFVTLKRELDPLERFQSQLYRRIFRA